MSIRIVRNKTEDLRPYLEYTYARTVEARDSIEWPFSEGPTRVSTAAQSVDPRRFIIVATPAGRRVLVNREEEYVLTASNFWGNDHKMILERMPVSYIEREELCALK